MSLASASASASAAAAPPQPALPPTATPRRRWPLGLALGAVAALLGLLALGLRQDPTALPSALLGQPFPAFDLPRLGAADPAAQAAPAGPALRHTALAGRARVINVWASWCGTCREEHPALLALAAELRAQGRADQLLGLNHKDHDAAARQWLSRQGGDPYHASIVDADGRLGLELGVYGVPETFVTDAAGRIVHRHVGALTPQVIRERILPLLAAGVAGAGR
ncbi:DsbE family thiol:disulfide interchange protein [Aquabacterium sp. OR-4]|uniref:DsbE family thiol:disulfide interchange protein n=1 Tax=Aquabacterium sp. OR-4 TaxID=2978127 RepID=UPI0028C6768C|nr:DsbE family thiol:disulfide interchange protein [Aquabacterium sp. OR-4]MDT7838708.1 DsbE family thiol:disulfide interchange protein [Aquabacterium sp. OR-4]